MQTQIARCAGRPYMAIWQTKQELRLQRNAPTLLQSSGRKLRRRRCLLSKRTLSNTLSLSILRSSKSSSKGRIKCLMQTSTRVLLRRYSSRNLYATTKNSLHLSVSNYLLLQRVHARRLSPTAPASLRILRPLLAGWTPTVLPYSSLKPL